MGLSGTGKRNTNVYKQFLDFFWPDCYWRGAIEEVQDSSWRGVSYFKNATHIGLTATPKKPKKQTIPDILATLFTRIHWNKVLMMVSLLLIDNS
jgi:hypothetical protein